MNTAQRHDARSSPGAGARTPATHAEKPRWCERDRRAAHGKWAVLASASAALLSSTAVAQVGAVWTHLGGGASRASASPAGTLSLSTPAWVVSRDLNNAAIVWVGQSSPVVTRDRVMAVGQVGAAAYVFSIDRRAGAVVWQSPIDPPTFSSYSSPVIDERGRTCIVASGWTVRAFDLSTGASRWAIELENPVVNASPVVTQDLWAADRLFITDYDAAGASGRLYCINISPRRATINPFSPGEIVWSVGVGGTSGNSPAYANGRVFVPVAGDYNSFPPIPSELRCYDAGAMSTPDPVWTYANAADPDARFFGGVSVSGGAVYAASYDFVGLSSTFNNSNLVKLDAKTGTLRWSVPSNRTNAIPIPLPPKPVSKFPRVLLSAGLNNFGGTAPNLQLFEDRGGAAQLVWDSAMATWIDLDGDGRVDAGEFMSVGGWSHQPAVSTGLGPVTVFAGTLPTSGNNTSFGACTNLRAINLDVLPAATGFVRAEFVGAGSSPALADGNIYTIGGTGLHAFGPTPPRFDVDGDGEITIEDLYAWEQGVGSRDVDGNGVANGVDRTLLVAELRRAER